MRICVTNDDGVGTTGITALARALQPSLEASLRLRRVALAQYIRQPGAHQSAGWP